MAKFSNEVAARAAGYTIEHQPERSRFAVRYTPVAPDGAEALEHDPADSKTLGFAQYELLGDTGIDFNHTLVDPSLRGTGIASILVEHALRDEIVHNRAIQASCWFVAGYLDKHPELRDTARAE